MNGEKAGEEFVALYNESGAESGDNHAIMGEDGAPVILRYDGEDLPWRVPVHINPTDWRRLLADLRDSDDMEFWLEMDETLYILFEHNYRDPHVHLARWAPDYVSFTVVDHGFSHVLREFESRCRDSLTGGWKERSSSAGCEAIATGTTVAGGTEWEPVPLARQPADPGARFVWSITPEVPG